MESKLGVVEIADPIRKDLKEFERLEGSRRTQKLIGEAAEAYLRVIETAIKKAVPEAATKVVAMAHKDAAIGKAKAG